MTTYPNGIDCIWLALDRDGHVAAFATGGAGPIPSSVLDDGQIPEDLELRIRALPRTSAARTLVSYKSLDDFVAIAERGIFAYDWSDVHRTLQDEIGAYELIAVPSKPIRVVDLPRDIAAFATGSKLDMTFDGANRLDVRRLTNCVEA